MYFIKNFVVLRFILSSSESLDPLSFVERSCYGLYINVINILIVVNPENIEKVMKAVPHVVGEVVDVWERASKYVFFVCDESETVC